jgi:hypothetical protein
VAILDTAGNPIRGTREFKKAKPPPLGEAFGQAWGKIRPTELALPGGGMLAFDTSKLELKDMRQMRTNYQVKASLFALDALMHQSTFTIECDDPKIAAHCEENLNEIWTALSSTMGVAHWAGFSPSILQWENDIFSKTVRLTKVKDMLPESAAVKWKEVPGYSAPGDPKVKLRIYDGIKEFGSSQVIPVDNSFWYAFQAEAGNMRGTRLLESAFQPWYFSQLIHLFANRYMDRYGEPAMVGRAPVDEKVTIGGREIDSNEFLSQQMGNLRSGAVTVLPNDGEIVGSTWNFDYQIEYLESQMRGVDFERYLTRLDEEISLALFTPLLLLRTADVGSYSLGTTHMQMFLWGLNSLNGDRKRFIDKYILSRMVDFNFSEKAPRAKIRFRKMGNDNTDLIKTVVAALMTKGELMPDITELSAAAGISLTKVTPKQDTAPVADPNADPADDDPGAAPPANDTRTTKGKPSATA